MKRLPLSRRTLLRGAGGIALGLPFLEAMLPRTARAADDARTRFVAMYFPDGTYSGTQITGRKMGLWQPANTGPLAGQTLPPVLEPLADNLGDFNVISGIDNRSAFYGDGVGGGGHNRAIRSFLTASAPDSSTTVNINPSMDQIIADHLAKTNTFARHSLVLGTMAQTKAPDSGSVTYMNHISYRNRTNVPLEKNPLKLFNSLFGSVTGGEPPPRDPSLHPSILDFVKADTTALMGKLGTADQQRVDEYLTSVRELERRVILAEEAAVSACQLHDAPPGTLTGEYQNSLPPAFTLQVEAMVDIIVTAFRCDLTRVATLLLAAESHNINYGQVIQEPYQGASVTAGRHIDSAHHQDNLAKIRRLISIHQYEVRFFKRMLDKLKTVSELGGTLLDNTIILYGCGLADGNAHNFSNIPLLVGGRGGGIVSGRHVAGSGVRLANLELWIMQQMGLGLTSFGKGQGISNGVFKLS